VNDSGSPMGGMRMKRKRNADAKGTRTPKERVRVMNDIFTVNKYTLNILNHAFKRFLVKTNSSTKFFDFKSIKTIDIIIK
jgi:hypothetical protein